MTRLLIVTTLLVSIPSLALAQQQGGGTDSERAACSPDVKRHCRQVIDQGDFAILGCLKDNRTKLRAACNRVLVSHGQ
jgi:hypothetical protein